ncbi:hypothetical protein [Kitasatospora purpeofusca]|uniref:hypothetical protein n=1 Tax=Kitasatospora purpeofusca TaxID=67352 RepID=UPI003867FD53|nr:hypothetical protein OIP63_02690 [Kitasatospora purpeofusca]
MPVLLRVDLAAREPLRQDLLGRRPGRQHSARLTTRATGATRTAAPHALGRWWTGDPRPPGQEHRDDHQRRHGQQESQREQAHTPGPDTMAVAMAVPVPHHDLLTTPVGTWPP